MKTIEYFNKLIQKNAPRLRCLSDAIWSRPELAYKEFYAVKEAKNFLEEQGFAVESPCFGLDTAFRAQYGSNRPCFAIFAEFDALPDVGHGCGHNLICAAGLGAFCAVAEALKTTGAPGRVVLLGSPAEESGGGKIKMIEAGCLDEIDAAMMVHPSFRSVPDNGSSAISRFDVIFHGKSAHAAGSPELGINALDAVNLVFAAVNAYREMIPEDARIHGIITNGGEAPNIIPALASCRFFLRSTNEEWIKKIEKRFLDIVKGAELMTGATAEIHPFNTPYMSRKPNAVLNTRFLAGISQLGMTYTVPSRGGRGSSDFGNVSQKVPGIHPYFAVSDHEIPCHSLEFREASGTDFAFYNAMTAAAAMAETAYTYITNPDFKKQTDADFRK